MISGYFAIPNLIATYAERMDRGDLSGVAALFEHATVTSEGTDVESRGTDAVLAMFRSWTRVYEDTGTPHSHHVTTNLILDVDDDAGSGTCRSYFTVFQATAELPLQPIIAGRYHDRFERVAGSWRFTARHMITDHVGDLSRHLLQALEIE
jgi:hypothetical protein